MTKEDWNAVAIEAEAARARKKMATVEPQGDDEHSQMLAFIGKSLFPQGRPTGVNHLGIAFQVLETSPTLTSPEELTAFVNDYSARMQAKHKSTTCGHCGNVFDECYGVEGCWT